MSATFRVIPTDQIRANPRNVRDDLGDLTELAASLRANGIQQPVIVTDNGGHYELVDGHRRHAAAQRAGINGMPAIVTDITGTRPTLVTMLAAAMHKQLTPLEQAKAFTALMDDGMPIRDIIAATGYSRATVNARISLLDLPDEAQDMVADGTLNLGQAVALAKDVKANRSGSALRPSGASKASWFTTNHRLHTAVKDCPHADTRTLVGNVACGQCWEEAIRADAIGELAQQAPQFDEAAVTRAVDAGHHTGEPMTRADRLEAVRRLVSLGCLDGQIAIKTGVTPRQALRDRQVLDLATPAPQFAHTKQRTAS